MNDFTHDREVVNFKLPSLTVPNREQLIKLLSDESTRWYALKKLSKFNKLGLTAGANWNELLHPRGPDGKFITKFGWVRFLDNGKWVRGFVNNIDDAGNLTVSTDSELRTFTNYEASKMLYALPKPKALLTLPTLGVPDSTWQPTGPQGGSNPGGKFELLNPDEHTLTITDKELFEGTNGVFSRKNAASTVIPGTTRTLEQDGGSYISITDALAKINHDEVFVMVPMDDDPPTPLFSASDSTEKTGVTYRVFSVVREGSVHTVRDVLSGENLGSLSSAATKKALEEIQDSRTDAGKINAVRVLALSGLKDPDAPVAVQSGFEAHAKAVGVLRNAVESAPAKGTNVYVKRLKTPDHVKNEVLANRLYELAGVPRPEVHFGKDPRTLGSVFLQGEDFQQLAYVLDDPEMLAKIRSDFVVDAWLANWDVAGLTYDNIVVVDGVPTRIDSGGSLLYRAQGSPKGKAFGGEVLELETLRSKSVNPQSAKVFGDTTTEELQAGARKVAAIHPDTIKAYVEEHGLDDSLALTLIARRAYIIDTILDGNDPFSSPVEETGLEGFTDEYILSTAASLVNYAVSEDKPVELGPLLTVEIEKRGLAEQVANLESAAVQLDKEGIDPVYPAVLPASDAAALATSTEPAWFWDSASGVWYRGPDIDRFQALAEAEQDLANAISSLEQFDTTSIEETATVSTDTMLGELALPFVGRMVVIGSNLFEVLGAGNTQESLATSYSLSSETVRLRNLVNRDIIEVPLSDFIDAHHADISPANKSKPSGLITSAIVLDPTEQEKEDLDLLIEAAHSAYLNKVLQHNKHSFDSYSSDSAPLNQSVVVSSTAVRPHAGVDPQAVTQSTLDTLASEVRLGSTTFIAQSSELAGAYGYFSSWSNTLSGPVTQTGFRLETSTSLGGRTLFTSESEGYFSPLRKFNEDLKYTSMANAIVDVKSLTPGTRVYIRPSKSQKADVWEVTKDGKLKAVALDTRSIGATVNGESYFALPKGVKAKEVASTGDPAYSLSDGSVTVTTSDYWNPWHHVVSMQDLELIIDPEDIDLSPLKPGGRPRVVDIASETLATSAASNAAEERFRIIKEAEAEFDAAITVAKTQQSASVSDKDARGSELVPAAVSLLAEAAKLPDFPESLITTLSYKFYPAKAGVKFIGVLDGSQVAPGMWVLLNPGKGDGQIPFNVNRPMYVEDIKFDLVDGIPTIKSLTVRGLNGAEVKYTSESGNMSDIVPLTKHAGGSYIYPVSGARIVRIAQPGVPSSEPSLKKDGTVVVDGVQVGTWTSYFTGNGGNGRRVVIDAEFTGTGQPRAFTARLTEVRRLCRSVIVISPEHVLKVQSKSAKAKAKKAAIVWKTGSLSDGSKVESGLDVRYVVDGSEGVIVGSIHPSRNDYVFVKFKDGSIDVVDTSALVNISAPTEPIVTVDVPTADLAPEVIEAMAKTPEKFTTADGNFPIVGMKVEAGKAGKVIRGYVTTVNDAGYIKVKDETTGKVSWRSIKVTKVIAAPGGGDTTLVAATAATIKTESSPEPDFALAGVEILQSAEDLEVFKAHGGITTFDGYIPRVGLPVIDRSGVRLVIAKSSSNKKTVLVYDPETPEKLKSRSVDALTIDVASYNGVYGAISEITLVSNGAVTTMSSSPIPQGSSIYSATSANGEKRGLHYLYAVAPNGNVYRSHKTYNGVVWQFAYHAADEFFAGKYLGGSIEKLGVVGNSETGTQLIFEVPKQPSTKILIDLPASDTPDIVELVASKKAELAPKIVTDTGVETLKPYTGTIDAGDVPRGVFPEPPATKKNKKRKKTGSAPAVTGAGADLSTKPAGMEDKEGVLSVAQAAESVITNRSAPAANGGVRYALMDEKLVEDTLVRFQVVRAPDGTEYVEMRFRLQEESSEALADQLLTSDSTEFGAWAMQDVVFPTELVEGDYISVSYSAEYGVLRPSPDSDIANARIVTAPVLIGASTRGGVPVYRAQVLLHTGETSYIDLEERSGASVARIAWDPDIVRTKKGTSWGLSPGAKDEGWTQVASGIGAQYPEGVHVDENGVAQLSPGVEAGDTSFLRGSGVTVSRTLPNGTVVKFNGVASTHGSTSHESPRRHEMARDVRVRVPIDDLIYSESDGVQSEELQRALSQGLEAVGITPEMQRPPDAEQLTRLAINKFNKQFSTTFAHRAQLNPNEISESDPTIEDALKKASARIGLTGEDAITLKDIEFVAAEDGRVYAVVSERVAQAVTKKQGTKFFTHRLAGGAKQLIEILGGMTSRGLFGADERVSLGIATRGMSTSRDAQIGSADRVYIRGRLGTQLGGSIVLSPVALNRTLDGYFNPGDKYGRRSEQNTMPVARPSGENNEFMIKRKLEASQIAYIIVNKTEREEIISALKERGVTSIGGRPVEDIVTSSPPKADASFTSLGVDLNTVATLEDLVAIAQGTVQEAAGASAPAGAAGGIV